MYNRQESSLLRQQFWTSFGRYMLPVPSAEGTKINWVNYKTGIKDLYFKMEAGNKTATIAIVMAHAEAQRQTIFFNQFMQCRKILENAMQEKWQWVLQAPDAHGKITSRIYASQTGVNVFNKEDWPAIISFFKPRIIALDAYWNEIKFSFEIL